jgi:hypothetical protein
MKKTILSVVCLITFGFILMLYNKEIKGPIYHGQRSKL